MKPTVETGYWSANRPNSQRELELQAQQVRTAVNRVLTTRRTVVSVGSGVSATLWIDDDELGLDVHASLTATVLATNATGSAYGRFEQTALFLRPGSAAAFQLGATQLIHPDIASAGVSIALGITGNAVFVSGNDGGAVLTWDLWIELRRA